MNMPSCGGGTRNPPKTGEMIQTLREIASEYLKQALPGAHLLLSAVHFALSFFFAVLMFGLVFAMLPNAETTWREIVAGALLSGVLRETFSLPFLDWRPVSDGIRCRRPHARQGF
jgi:hypothetical protein